MKILVLGCTGMIGSAIFSHCQASKNISVYGTFKKQKKINIFNKNNKLIYFDASKKKQKLKNIINKIKPNFVINCIGITKHINNKNEKEFFQINSYFPHYAKKISNQYKSKFIQISTDCVFDGKRGNYSEQTKPNANDLYGKSKAAGEIKDKVNLTIRTSTIGHELSTKYGLLEWFLSNKKTCYGYKKAYFNGLPTNYLAKILLDLLLKYKITGLIHISGKKISKYELLKIIKKVYKKKIDIFQNSTFKIDRTLNNYKLKNYIKPNTSWKKLIQDMKKNYEKRKFV